MTITDEALAIVQGRTEAALRVIARRREVWERLAAGAVLSEEEIGCLPQALREQVRRSQNPFWE